MADIPTLVLILAVVLAPWARTSAREQSAPLDVEDVLETRSIPWSARIALSPDGKAVAYVRVETPVLLIHGAPAASRRGGRLCEIRWRGTQGQWSRASKRDSLERIIRWFDDHLKEAPK